MNCYACGTAIHPGSVFCHKCGARIDERATEGDDPADAESTGGAAASAVKSDQAERATPRERFVREADARRGGADQPEIDLWQAGYSSKAMLGTWVACAGATIALVAIALVLRTSVNQQSWLWLGVAVAVIVAWAYPLALLTYRRFNVRYRLTNQRFFHERGIISRSTDRIEVIDIKDVSFDQPFFQRLVGVGTIKIVSSDYSHPELLLEGIDDVKNVASILDNARLAERKRRGLFVEGL